MIASPAFSGKKYAVYGLARSGLATVDALAASGAEGRIADWLRADTEFHLLIGRTARNERLARAIEEGRAGLFRPVGAVWARLEDRAHDQHAEIHAAIGDGDGERAAAAMTAHLEATRADVHAVSGRTRR